MRWAWLILLAGCGAPMIPGTQGRTTVVLFISTQCPISNAYNARMADLAREFPQVAFIGVNPNLHETEAEVAEHARRAGFPFRVLRDVALADRMNVHITPTAVLLDASGAERYRGRIDDHKDETLVRRRHLRIAIEEVLAGKTVSVAETEAVGCRVKRPVPEGRGDVTYAKHVAPILNRHCVSCHRAGNIGPFPMETYEQARAWALEIRNYTVSRRMPPWKPLKADVAYADAPRITDEEIGLIARWAERGAPRGNAADEAPRAKFGDEWALGKPDLVLEPEADYELGGRGADEYRSFVLQPNFTEDRYLSAVEFKPGNPKVVHHVFVYLDKTGIALKRDREDPGPGFSSKGTGPGFMPVGDLGGWGPGMLPRALPKGVAYLVPKGAVVVMEVHYHKSGRVERDRTKIGLTFAREPVLKRLRSAVVLNMSFEIPPGAERHEVRAKWKAPFDIHLQAITPHMHMLGREILVDAKFPDGTVKRLVHIDDWDFNWQQHYWLKSPLAIPKGTVLKLQAWFDNSEKNPNNPNRPPRAVRFGEDTTDEMAVAYLMYTRDDENPEK